MPSSSSDRELLLPSSQSQATYGVTPLDSPHARRSSRRTLLVAGSRMTALFLVSCLILGGTLWLALPTLDPEDRNDLRIPRSFAQLQALNALLKKYRHVYPYRIIVCYVTVYFFLQAFSIPGSMYLSILGGAVWGVPIALPLVCACVASGATLCYLISSALGPALLTLPTWRIRLETWSEKVAEQQANLLSFLILLRLAPLPPHWMVNILCPHIGIGIIPFWISTFLGVLGVSVIHTRIGQTLDEMTSVDDFHLISWQNFFGLAAVVVGVLIPVGLRYYFREEAQVVAETEADAERRELIADTDNWDADPAIVGEPTSIARGTKPNPVTALAPLSEGGSSESEDYGNSGAGIVSTR